MGGIADAGGEIRGGEVEALGGVGVELGGGVRGVWFVYWLLG